MLNNGEAAHISGRLPGSARYDPKLTDKERSHIKNGIWLCRRCAKMIDDDEVQFPNCMVEEWKENTITYVKKNYGIPRKEEKLPNGKEVNYLGYFPQTDFDGRFYHNGIVVFYRTQFVFGRSVTLVTMTIEKGSVTTQPYSLVPLGTLAQQAYQNGIGFKVFSRALGKIYDSKMKIMSGIEVEMVSSIVSALDFSNVDHIGPGPFDIAYGTIGDKSHTFLFDLSPFWNEHLIDDLKQSKIKQPILNVTTHLKAHLKRALNLR